MAGSRTHCVHPAAARVSAALLLSDARAPFAGLAAAFVLLALILGAVPARALTDATDVTVLLRRAESGDARAAFLLGMRYARPEDSSRDDVEAVRWLRLAAEEGLAEAQYNLGIMYANGRGVATDAEQAAKWYRQAAEQGLASAQYNLGAQYAVGDGVARDEERAAHWFELAARQDVPEAAYNLGVLYDLGRGVKPNAATAMHWYERSAARGYHPAASRLAALRAANPTLAAKPETPSEAVADTYPPAQSSQSTAAAVSVAASAARAAVPREPQPAGDAGTRSASPWLAGLNPTHYTLQVLSHTNESSVRHYLESNFAPGEAGYFAFELDGKTWFTVVYGDYASYADAVAAGNALAGRLEGRKPWVRKIAIIQKAAIR